MLPVILYLFAPLVLLCWPRDWDVSFKLHAPKLTTVEVVYRAGAIQRLQVTPAARRADIVLPDLAR